MTGELDKERNGIGILFRSDSVLKEFYELYAIEEHGSPREIDIAFVDEVSNCDVYLLLLNIELRDAVLKEFDTAVETNKKMFMYVKSESSGRKVKLSDFIKNTVYKYHPNHFLDTHDLCNKLNDDLQSDLIRSYHKDFTKVIEEKEEYRLTKSTKPETGYRYFPLGEIKEYSNHESIKGLTADQLLSLSSVIVDDSGNYKLGLLLLEIGLVKNPDNWMLHNNRGLLLDSMGLASASIFSFTSDS